MTLDPGQAQRAVRPTPKLPMPLRRRPGGQRRASTPMKSGSLEVSVGRVIGRAAAGSNRRGRAWWRAIALLAPDSLHSLAIHGPAQLEQPCVRAPCASASRRAASRITSHRPASAAAPRTDPAARCALSDVGVELVPSLQAASAQSLRRALAGGGFTLLSRLTIEAEQRAGVLVGLPVRGVDLHRELRAVRRQRPALTVAARAFWR